MSELEEKLEGILGNPQAMAQIMALAQSLNGGGGTPPAEGGPSGPPAGETGPIPAGGGPPGPSAGESGPTPAAPPLPGSGDGKGGLGDLLGGLDPKLLSAAAGLIGQFNSGADDQRAALLAALRPFVKERRYAKLDKAIQIAKLSRLIRSGLELLRAQRETPPGEEGGHV